MTNRAAHVIAVALAALAFGPAEAKSPLPQLACTPAAVHAGDTLHIVMPSPHGRYLEVKPPSGENISIAFAFDDKGRAIIPEKEFLAMKTLDLKVSEAKGFDWARMQTVKLFDKPGTYKFGLGDDFETDVARVDGECTVQFSP